MRELRKLRRGLAEQSRADAQIRKTQGMIDYLEDNPEWPEVLDGDIFDALIDRLLLADGELRIMLQNGLEVVERMA